MRATKLSADDLPRSTAATMHARILRFSAHARFLAQALAFDEEFSDADYRTLLPSTSSRDVELAMFELLGAAALMRDGAMYRLANRVWSAAFVAALDAEQTKLTHRALTAIDAGRDDTGFTHHAFAAGLDEQQQHAAELDDMATGAETGAPALSDSVSLDGSTYQLLALRCVIESASVLVGVAVIERAEGQDFEPQVQLLSFLAVSLLESGK